MSLSRWLFVLALAAGALLALAIGCGGDDDDDNDSGTEDDDTGDDDTGENPFAEAEANLGEWVWVPVEGMICRDGSATGIGVRLQEGADRVAIFLQGGGACYDAGSCADNPSAFGEADFADEAPELADGIFSTTNADNPLRDWNAVFVPYCTGDLFAGNKPDGDVPGVEGKQQFVGHPNMVKVLELVQPYFAEAASVFLVGASAGGFGTMLTYALVADSFAPTPVVMLDDSGPILEDDDALSPCLQLVTRILWNAGPSIPEDCADCLQDNGDGMANLHAYLAETYPDGTFGLASFLADDTIRDFFGAGQNNCQGGGPIPEEVFRQALLDMRDQMLVPAGNWATFYAPGTDHTFTQDDAAFATAVGEVTFGAWLTDLLAGTITQVEPE